LSNHGDRSGCRWPCYRRRRAAVTEMTFVPAFRVSAPAEPGASSARYARTALAVRTSAPRSRQRCRSRHATEAEGGAGRRIGCQSPSAARYRRSVPACRRSVNGQDVGCGVVLAIAGGHRD
jgi:hypothetical protein